MFSNKPISPRPDPKREQDIALGELKRRYQVLMMQMNNIPETPDVFVANDENLRRSLLDQREAYSNIITSLTIIQACIQDTIRVWPEGRQVLSLLMDSSRLWLKNMENTLEENHLWDRRNPEDNYSQNRRAQIFAENRKLASESDKKLLEGSELLYQLTNWNLFDFDEE
jgi:hypothetical protein